MVIVKRAVSASTVIRMSVPRDVRVGPDLELRAIGSDSGRLKCRHIDIGQETAHLHARFHRNTFNGSLRPSTEIPCLSR